MRLFPASSPHGNVFVALIIWLTPVSELPLEFHIKSINVDNKVNTVDSTGNNDNILMIMIMVLEEDRL